MNREQLIRELEALYRRRYRQFLRVAIAVVGDEAGGHDAVQDGFARAIRSAGSFRGDGSVEAWTWRIVVNAARPTRRERSGADEGIEALGTAPSRESDSADADAVRAWVAALPERQRLAVFLRYYADLDYRGIATALGVETGTV